jgi:hypothetical protein
VIKLARAVVFAALTSACVEDTGAASASSFAADVERPELALLEYGLIETGMGGTDGDKTTCTMITRDRGPEPIPPEAQTALSERFGNLRGLDGCEWRDGLVVERSSGAEARYFTVFDVTCERRSRCTGYVGWVAANMGAKYEQYTMTFSGGLWSFERTGRTVMS